MTATQTTAACTAKGCRRPRWCRDLCRTHYDADRRQGQGSAKPPTEPTARVEVAGALGLIAEIVRGTPALPDAACRDRPGEFDADSRDRPAAREACAACPARSRCGEWAATRQARVSGVLAGQLIAAK